MTDEERIARSTAPLSEEEKAKMTQWLKNAFDPARKGLCATCGRKIVWQGLVPVCGGEHQKREEEWEQQKN